MAQQQQQQVNITDLDLNSLQQVKAQLEEVKTLRKQPFLFTPFFLTYDQNDRNWVI